ncbi:MAG TPA: heat-shock protein Hsp20 [Methylophilaceae bacterium]|nr:heat-shock protein Hsp20 [Methylophilaceae bacterium]HAJ72302.1 heat-shock protein Hsp20 [Methylophilaceae bacterium]
MANLTRFDPFNINVATPLDEVFEGFFRPVLAGNNTNIQIKIDVQEEKELYKVHADIPGAKKEDVHVDVDGNVVHISAETKRENEVKEGTKVIRSERYFGKVARSFSLDTDIDEANAKAEYKDGVLELTLPKKIASNSKRLEVR